MKSVLKILLRRFFNALSRMLRDTAIWDPRTAPATKLAISAEWIVRTHYMDGCIHEGTFRTPMT
jgi:hypothetical protein